MANGTKKSGGKKYKSYKLPPESDKHAAYTRVDEESDFAYTIVTTNGKPKSLVWSVLALIIGILSVVLGFFGWAGVISAVVGLFLSILAWRLLGFFNLYILIGLISSIFGATLGVAFILAESFKLF